MIREEYTDGSKGTIKTVYLAIRERNCVDCKKTQECIFHKDEGGYICEPCFYDKVGDNGDPES